MTSAPAQTARAAEQRVGARGTLTALFAGNFVLGTAETLVIGLLVVLAGDLGVSVPSAGALVTAYAAGLALGGPLLTAATIRWDRRWVVLGSVAVFVVGNLLAVVTADYVLFVVARAATGAAHGLFLATAFGLATSVVSPTAAGRAMSTILLGNTLAGAFGAPLGTAAGQAVGWRGAFAAVAALGVVVLVAMWFVVPRLPGATARTGGRAQLRYAFAPRVVALLLLCTLVFASACAAWSYVVPFLRGVTQVPAAWTGAFVLLYGVGTAVGAYLGGRAADRDAGRALVVGSIGLTISLTVLHLLGSSVIATAVALVALGFFTMGMAPSLQYRVVALAGPGAPVAQSLPASSANVGVAAGTAAGGVAIAQFGVPAAVVVGAVVGAAAILVAVATSRLRPASASADAEAVDSPNLATGTDRVRG